MLRRHAADTAAVTALAAGLTLLIAAPVLRAPSERVFGAAIVGRHHDPFTVMQQFSHPLTLGVYLQPVTDLTGAAIARGTGAVAAYNWLVLVTFPLSAAIAYLLARYLTLPRAAAVFAALLFAFSPFHFAHAAYHPHIAQTQWLPLYLLALWRCLDRGTWPAALLLCVAAALVTLSNFYGGLIAAVMTPFAAGGWWLMRTRFAPRPGRRLAVTAGALIGIATAATAFVWWRTPDLPTMAAALAFPRQELFLYSAKWWSYLLPPVVHPLWGALSARLWVLSGVHAGLLEQQVSLGWSVITLAAIGIASSSARLTGQQPSDSRAPDRSLAPMLGALAAVALICSLSPERALFGTTVLRPSALVYAVLPMFRAYARFGLVVQLMAALLAGIGAARLAAIGTRSARLLCAVLVLLAAVEYGVSPQALSRDVLPTEAHRWVMRHSAASRVLDCEPLTPESSSVPWLTDGRITLAGAAADDCAEPQLAPRLRAEGFTHVLVRDTWQRDWLRRSGAAEGLRDEARFAAADVFSINPRTLVYTIATAGFWPREYDGASTWRWMSTDASWTIVTSAARPRVTLEIEIRAFGTSRPLSVRLDDRAPQSLQIATDSATYRIGPVTLAAGTHQLTFHSPAPPIRPDDVIGGGDRRPLGFRVGDWTWSDE
jgi:hypothetical protein